MHPVFVICFLYLVFLDCGSLHPATYTLPPFLLPQFGSVWYFSCYFAVTYWICVILVFYKLPKYLVLSGDFRTLWAFLLFSKIELYFNMMKKKRFPCRHLIGIRLDFSNPRKANVNHEIGLEANHYHQLWTNEIEFVWCIIAYSRLD